MGHVVSLKAQLTTPRPTGRACSWKTSHPTGFGGGAAVRTQRAFEVAESPRSGFEMRFSGSGPGRLQALAVAGQRRGRVSEPRRAAPRRIVSRIGSAAREEDLRDSRKLAKSATCRLRPGIARKILEERFAIIRDLPAALPVIRYYLGNPIFPREPRLSLPVPRTVQVLEALCSRQGSGSVGVKPDYPLSLSARETDGGADSVLPWRGSLGPAAGAAPNSSDFGGAARFGTWAAANSVDRQLSPTLPGGHDQRKTDPDPLVPSPASTATS